MDFSLNIILDKNIKDDYCILSQNAFDEDQINLILYTNGKKPIDYKSMNYISINDEQLCDDFLSYFSLGRKITENIKEICVSHKGCKEKNTLEQNRELKDLIELNNFSKRKMYFNVGDISLTKEDIDLIEPLNAFEYGLVTFDETNIYHSIKMMKKNYEIISEIVKRTKKHDFSELEQVLFAYDIIRTNFIIDDKYRKNMEEIIELYPEPSFCYALIFKEVLTKLGIKNDFSSGCFYKTECRAMNIVKIEDDIYDIDGIYYFDIGRDSKQRFDNSLINYKEEDIKEELINNYSGFCKTKDFMIYRGSLDMDYEFGIFDRDFMELFDQTLDQYGPNGIFQLKTILNNVGYFVDGKPVIDDNTNIDDMDLDEIRDIAEKYTALFDNEIDGEDFLELLFNVRKVEYMENKSLFQLTIPTLRDCVFKSKFNFSGMTIELSEDQEYEQEDIMDAIEESFDIYFEETMNNTKMEERIKKLKLSLNKDNNSDNNDKK